MTEVYVLMSGEAHEGGSVYGIYATRELALAALVDAREYLIAENPSIELPAIVVNEGDADDFGDAYWEASFINRCDWYEVSLHVVEAA